MASHPGSTPPASPPSPTSPHHTPPPSRRASLRPSTSSSSHPTVALATLSAAHIRALALALSLIPNVPPKWAIRSVYHDMISAHLHGVLTIPEDDAHELIGIGMDIIQGAATRTRTEGEGRKGEGEQGTDTEGEVIANHAARTLQAARARLRTARSAPSTLSLNFLGTQHSLPSVVPATSSSYAVTPPITVGRDQSRHILSATSSTSDVAPPVIGRDQSQHVLSGTPSSHTLAQGTQQGDMMDMMRAMLAQALMEERRSHMHAPAPAPAPPTFTPAQLAYMRSVGVSLPVSAPALPTPVVAYEVFSVPSTVSPQHSTSTAPACDAIPVVNVHAIVGDQLKPFDPVIQESLRNGTCWDLDKHLRLYVDKEDDDVLETFLKGDGTMGTRKKRDKRTVKTLHDLNEAITEGCLLLTEHALVRDRVQFLALVTRFSLKHGLYQALRYARCTMEHRLSPLSLVPHPTIAQRCISALYDHAAHGLTAPIPSSASSDTHKRKATVATKQLGDASGTSRSKRARADTTNNYVQGYIPDSCRNYNRTGCTRPGCKYTHVCMWCGSSHAAPTPDACKQKGGRPTPPGPAAGGPETGT